jgi:hypothetical protein
MLSCQRNSPQRYVIAVVFGEPVGQIDRRHTIDNDSFLPDGRFDDYETLENWFAERMRFAALNPCDALDNGIRASARL